MKSKFARQAKLPGGAYPKKSLLEVLQPYMNGEAVTMKWGNLKENKCPKCDKDFVMGLSTMPVAGKGQLLAHECGFKIYEHRYQQIVSGQVIQQLEKNLQKGQPNENIY